MIYHVKNKDNTSFPLYLSFPKSKRKARRFHGGLFALQQISENSVHHAVNGDGRQLQQQQRGKPPPGHGTQTGNEAKGVIGKEGQQNGPGEQPVKFGALLQPAQIFVAGGL